MRNEKDFKMSLRDGFKDEIRTNVDIYLSWKDRIKVLFGWRLHVTVKVFCEKLPGRVEGQSKVHVWKPSWWPHKPMGAMEVVSSPKEEMR